MIRFATLYSGSSGNATAIWANEGVLLIDMGGSCRRTVTALREIGLEPEDVKGILITHEHSDHIQGLRVFCRKYHVPVFASKHTIDYFERNHWFDGEQELVLYQAEEPFHFCGFDIVPFENSHDSISCHGFEVLKGNRKITVCTDLGVFTEETYRHLKGSQLVALEANYDDWKLTHGPYPKLLQMRIRGEGGHLSNDDFARAMVRLVQDGTKMMVLMHLSAENNSPSDALTTCYRFLEEEGLSEDCCHLEIAPRFETGPILEVM